MPTYRLLAIFAACVLLPACSPTPAPEAAAPRPATTSPTSSAQGAAQGQAFAAAHCASCHGVARNSLSPIPQAPAFEEIVNTPGLTPQTLATWLRDSHNYPEMMNFEIAPEQLDSLSAYMLTLRNTR